ncbi:hypothetical protein LAZ67_12001917, partial [Cordylochernes scorpioides]
MAGGVRCLDGLLVLGFLASAPSPSAAGSVGGLHPEPESPSGSHSRPTEPASRRCLQVPGHAIASSSIKVERSAHPRPGGSCYVAHHQADEEHLRRCSRPWFILPPSGGEKRGEIASGEEPGGSRGAAWDGHAVLAHQHTHCASHVGASPPDRRSHLVVSPALGACRRRAPHQAWRSHPSVRCSFVGHAADIALRLALHALPHPGHPASSQPVAGPPLLVLQRRPPSHLRGVFHHRAAAGPAVLDLHGGPRRPRHHHLLNGEAWHLRFLRRSRNAWCRWGPIGDLPSNSAAVAEAPYKYDRAFKWKYRGGSLIDYFHQKQRKMRLGMPGLSEKLLIIGVIHGLPPDMQNQLSTVKIENKETLLQLLKNIRPSLEKKPFEPKPYQTTGNTVVKKPAYFAQLDQIEEASQTMNNQNNSVSSLKKKLNLEGCSIPMTKSILFLSFKSPDSMFPVIINGVKTCCFLGSSDDLITIFPKLCNVSKKELPLHEIDFLLKPNNNIVACKPYPMSDHKRAWTAGKIKEMLDGDIITPSTSEYASPCILVPKTDSSYRLCIDYRQLNKETLLDPFPFPRIDSIINKFGGCRYFTKIDLKDGFWQVGLTKATRKFSAFVTPDGLYEFKRLLFGWKNSPPRFQRVMSEMLADLLELRVVVYVDDICCVAPTFEECASLTYKVLNRQNQYNMTVNLGKCQICVSEVELLDRIINGNSKQMKEKASPSSVVTQILLITATKVLIYQFILFKMANQPVSSAELKKLRTPVRARFTKAFNELETEIKKNEVKKAAVEKILRRLQTHHEKLSILNMRMEEALLRESASEDILTAEYESVCEYEDNFSNIMTDYEALAEKDDVSTISGTAAMNYQLPKLEFKKFGGEPREWITFWSQFSTIDRDPQMPPETKFQYLFQATAENSEVREAVESFPPSADNYPKVIEYIKSCFGEDEMLVEIYVRDLLQNVLQNVRAEARDKFAAMLYPLVESALPEDTLRVWERSQYTVSGRGVQDKLTQIMTFLKTEVKGESRVNMAKAAFKIDNNQGAKDDRSNRKSLSKKNTGKCYSGQRMHLPEKKDKAKGKNVCFWCLLPGHGIKKCRIKPRCPVCGGKHYPIMCPTLEAQKTSHLQKAELKVSGESPATKQKTANQFTSTTLNNATVGGVYLQTLIVKISGPKGKHNVRVLLDCGSQRSYISKRMVDALGLKRVQQVTLTHNLFGGGENRQKKHKVYKVNVSSLNNEYMDDLKFLDQEVICGHISQVQDHTILNELKARGINLTDICQGEEISIHMLIGSDLLSSILTGRMQILQNGVVATETKLGWTVMGPAIGKDMEDSCLIVTSFHVNSFDVQDLWKLDVLGIMDAAETKSRKDLIEASNTHFKETVKRDESGRYIVSLPWIAGHPPVPVNRRTTENRLLTTTRNVQGKMLYEKYDTIFEEWEKEKFIEEVEDKWEECSYLPHRPVLKDSHTTPIRPIQVREEDREFLRFLWWKKDQKTLKFYRHCRVVFGLSSSPFLLAATIKYHLSLPQFQDNSILSACHRIFDPIQFTCPATIKIKMVQDAWKENKSWDEPLNEDRRVEFIKWRKQPLELDQIKIPRWILPIKGRTTLHVFCDASAIAYATVIFMRIENASVIVVRFVEVRNRLATIKRITIPRLELLACLIGARLLVHVLENLEESPERIQCWTDSSPALYWIQQQENWAQFVSNRVKEITTLTKSEDWNHVAGEHNPADLPSRGESPSKFTKSGWWEGPKWLQEKKEDWPVSKVQYDLEAIEEERRKTVVAGFVAKKPEENPWYLNLYEGKREVTLTQILRVIAWMLRFKPFEYKGDIISQEELDSAEKSLFKIIQSESIGEEDPKMKQLHAFQDKEGLWRVKTRIVNRNDDELFRLPILIPTNHPVTELIVKSVHEKMYHCGAQTLRSVLREKFWIPKARQLVLHVTGIDLGGPLYLEDGQKVWFVIFTCGVYLAVHLELVTSLSTETLVGAVERFVARRGCPAVIYSDNGTNLVGLQNELYRVNFGVKWKLNPPAAPWWGGWIERIVGLTKKLLRRLLGKRVVNYEEMVTILENCERVINARPLTYIAEDNDELVPLTPEMFLREPRTEGEIDLNEFRCNFGKSYEKRKRLLKEFRKRFRSEYLGLLVHHDNRKKQRQLKVGDIVLVEVENRKQINWPMGKITKVFPGTDNVRRLVEVKTKSGFMKRAVQQLFPLEVPSEDVEQGDGELKPAEDEIVREKTPGVESVSVQEKTTPVKASPSSVVTQILLITATKVLIYQFIIFKSVSSITVKLGALVQVKPSGPCNFFFLKFKTKTTLIFINSLLTISNEAIILSAYQYKIEYIKGTSNAEADVFSRLPMFTPEQNPKEHDSEPVEMVLLMDALDSSPVTSDDIRSSLPGDPALRQALDHTLQGWSEETPKEMELMPFWSRRYELGACEETIRRCNCCQSHASMPPRTTPVNWPSTNQPWDRVHIDHLGPFEQNLYLIVVDACTKWIEAIPVPNTSTRETIEQLRCLLARFGIPRTLVSDNGTGFTSEEFRQFMTRNGIRHLRTAPFHPSFNGLAERAVQTIKTGLKKVQQRSISQPLAEILLGYRRTPIASIGKSPSEMMFGHNIRSRLDLILPNPGESEEPGFKVGESVWYRTYKSGPKWDQASIQGTTGNRLVTLQTAKGPRMYPASPGFYPSKGCNLYDLGEKFYLIPTVISEIKDKATRMRLENLPYQFEQRSIPPEIIKLVANFAKKTGDFQALSQTDIQVIALTYLLEKENVGTEHLREAPQVAKVGALKPESTKLPGWYDPTKGEEGEWIGPETDLSSYLGNIELQETEAEDLQVACLTTDFAMQNVLMQIGLKVISVGGMLIKETRTHILRCTACYKTTSKMEKVFCPTCGNKTLKKVGITTHADGTTELHINFKKPLNIRGLNASLPKPKGGKHSNNPILVEDQPRPHNELSKKAKQKSNFTNDSAVDLGNPFATRDITSRSAQLGLH